MRKSLSLIAAACILTVGALSSFPAYALDLATAKKEGYIGERSDGLIGAVFSNSSQEVIDLINTTNTGRLAVYQDMAEKQGISLFQVQEMAGMKLYAKEAAGNYIQVNGTWSVKKGVR